MDAMPHTGRTRPRALRVHLFVLAVLVVPPRAGLAQDASTYPTVRNPEKFSIDWRRFYERADALTAETRRAWPHHLNLAYGTDPKRRLDVYLPRGQSDRPWPVFIFLHGGGFREGDRAHYGFVAAPFAARGIATIVASYRLHPHRYPDQVRDTRRILAWTHENGAQYGLDREGVYIGGHSAGAILSALAGLKSTWADGIDLPVEFVKGIVPVSGPYDLRTATGFVNDFVDGALERRAASPLLNIDRTPPAVVAFGSNEAGYQQGSRALVDELKRRGGRAELVVLEGLGHDGTALAIGDANGPLFEAVRRMITGR
jgi:acetyl esterase/lipase